MFGVQGLMFGLPMAGILALCISGLGCMSSLGSCVALE